MRGAFHTDVLAVGTGAFVAARVRVPGRAGARHELRRLMGSSLRAEIATEASSLSPTRFRSYAFNSQLVTLADGSMIVLAPEESRAER